MAEQRGPWWRGGRGEWLVAAQVLLIALVFLGPRSRAWPAPWNPGVARVARCAGGALMFGGLALFLAGLTWLGSSLSPLPRPKEHGHLVRTGPYRLVRHPVYAGGILFCYGWALWVCGWLTLLYATLLLVFLGYKAVREERWLRAKFPEYQEYAARVRRLIPFIY
jgi:protein-S-isoprenylcysteine O-methyltransferase Ste14